MTSVKMQMKMYVYLIAEWFNMVRPHKASDLWQNTQKASQNEDTCKSRFSDEDGLFCFLVSIHCADH